MSQVLIVGCGCTGALVAALLRRSKKHVTITMWDKSKGAGGRMSTSRSPQDSSCTADLGCQYITQHSSYLNKHLRYYEELKNAGILVPLNTEIEYAKNNAYDTNYVTPAGVSSIVKYYIKESQCCSFYQRHLDSIVKKEGSWMVKAKDGSEGVFDSIVLTIPVPQLFLLQGDMPSILEANSQVKSNLEEVAYSSRYALGLFFDKGVKLEESWSGKYVNDHPIFRFIAIDNEKRGQAGSAPSVVFHTSVPFGKQHLEKTLTEVEPILLKAIKEMFPNWPVPTFVKTQKWRYSQVSKPYPGSPGCVVLSESPSLILAGDAFSHSNFDGCILSTEAVLNEIKDKL